MRLKDRVAIVTGSGSGIGRATAALMAREGARVVVADIADEAGQETARMIREAGGEAVACRADVGRAQGAKKMVATALRAYGRLDILHNNAFWHRTGNVVDLEERDWDRTQAVCLKAIYLGGKYAIPEMLKTGGGAIVNTSSIHSLVSFGQCPAYDSAKAGILGLTRTMALDFGPEIRVNAVLPGAIQTPAWKGATQKDFRWWAERTPMGRMGQPEDIAKAVVFLASEDASFITGECLVVDGGWTIHGHAGQPGAKPRKRAK
jgi:NAD(P)-dependent dehydrogenase (short-subunit alcohol dehydrogenase family)